MDMHSSMSLFFQVSVESTHLNLTCISHMYNLTLYVICACTCMQNFGHVMIIQVANHGLKRRTVQSSVKRFLCGASYFSLSFAQWAKAQAKVICRLNCNKSKPRLTGTALKAAGLKGRLGFAFFFFVVKRKVAQGEQGAFRIKYIAF